MTKNITLIFPGQGSQYIGMGSQLEGHKAYEYLAKANDSLNYSLSRIMLEGPDEELKLTKNTQPAILTHSIALLEKLNELIKDKDIKITKVLGHSVGEYSALVAAGVMEFKDAVKAVHLRGKYMQEAVPSGEGKMFAILKVPVEIIIKACEESSTEAEKVMPANFNEPNQIVISGHTDACLRAVDWISNNYDNPHKAVELNVSAPFHSSLMKPARENLKKHLDSIKFESNKIPYIANINANQLDQNTPSETIKENLVKQVDGPVLWTQSIEKLSDDDLVIEVGPGRVLMGLLRKINRNLKVVSLDKDGAFDQLEELLK